VAELNFVGGLRLRLLSHSSSFQRWTGMATFPDIE
jgi:hypothetical protein